LPAVAELESDDSESDEDEDESLASSIGTAAISGTPPFSVSFLFRDALNVPRGGYA
jgi:hypothetical protein